MVYNAHFQSQIIMVYNAYFQSQIIMVYNVCVFVCVCVCLSVCVFFTCVCHDCPLHSGFLLSAIAFDNGELAIAMVTPAGVTLMLFSGVFINNE